jgi:outer membrane immunogenic protein
MWLELRRPITIVAALAAITWMGAGGPVNAAQEIGKAGLVRGSITGRVDGHSRKLSTGKPIYAKERITAKSKSAAEFVLWDKSRISIGPGSTIVLDEFLVSSRKKGVTLSLLKGALRFTSGTSGNKGYRIKTPTASLGVRGTEFRINVGREKTGVLLLRGGIDVCGKDGCKELKKRCSWATVDRGGKIQTGNCGSCE